MSTTDRPIGLSTWEQQIYDYLVAHIESEHEIMAGYEEVAATAPEPWVRYLLGMIAADEKRHHQLYQQWADTIRSMGELDMTGEIPPVTREEDPRALWALVEQYIEVEKEDAHELKSLHRTLKDFEDVTLWPLLVELMQADTDKHIRILEFIRDHAKHSAKGH